MTYYPEELAKELSDAKGEASEFTDMEEGSGYLIAYALLKISRSLDNLRYQMETARNEGPR